MRLLSRLAPHCDASDLQAHFVLGAPPPTRLPGWESHSLGRWTLHVEPRLPALDALDTTGNQLGWLVGNALDLETVQPVERPVIDVDSCGGDMRLATQRWVDRHAGRFVLLLVGADVVVPDSSASLPVLFDGERATLASSPFLLQASGEPIPDDELVDVLRVNETVNWFLFDTTPHARARRLLPNHALDLGAWRQERQWPTEPFERGSHTELVERVAWAVERTIAAAAVGGLLNQSLTAGGDTRVMLACSRPVLDRIRFFTVEQPDWIGRGDRRISTELASRFGLDHRMLPWQGATPGDRRRFMIRTGALAGEERGSHAGPTYALLGDSRPYVSGVHERASMGFAPGDDADLRLDGRDVLRRYSMPLHPRLIDAATRWLAELPSLDAIDTLTLLGTELRLGLWGGALTTAYPDAYTYTLYPFGHRSILDAALRMEFTSRRFGAYREELIRTRWPELLEYELNPEPLRVRAVQRARQLPIARPARPVVRGLRKVRRNAGSALGRLLRRVLRAGR